MLTDPARRRDALAARREYRQFAKEFGPVFRPRLHDRSRSSKHALIVSIGMPSGVKVELALIKALELAGYIPIVLTGRSGRSTRYYRLAGVDRFVFWDDFMEPVDPEQVDRELGRVDSFTELVALECANAQVGKYAASTALRQMRLGAFDLSPVELRACFRPFVQSSLAYAAAARRLVATLKPDLALSMDPGYTPRGELYDACLAAGVDTITWNAAHKGNTLMLKRYHAGNRDVHPASLSDESWRRLGEEPWTEGRRQMVRDELSSAYASGDWYSEVGTQFNTRVVPVEEILTRLGIDRSRKTAVIFPHIFWDGTFFWGTDLFRSYEEWFVETVRAAAANRGVNWVIKIHPAHMVKNARDGISGESSEMIAIRRHFSELPAHMRLIPANSDINTFSLFGAVDYCLTVRGTVGIEAATFGIPVLTAGSGRYDRRGFTIDSSSRDEYLGRVRCIQTIPRLSAAEQELAERYAYGLFVRRPMPLRTVVLEYEKNAKASPRTHVNARTADELRTAPDLRAFSEWVTSGREDFDALDGGPELMES